MNGLSSRFTLIVTSFTIDKMFEIYTFSKIGPKYALFSKIGSKFAFCSKIRPKISNILLMADEVTIRVSVPSSGLMRFLGDFGCM